MSSIATSISIWVVPDYALRRIDSSRAGLAWQPAGRLAQKRMDPWMTEDRKRDAAGLGLAPDPGTSDCGDLVEMVKSLFHNGSGAAVRSHGQERRADPWAQRAG